LFRPDLKENLNNKDTFVMGEKYNKHKTDNMKSYNGDMPGKCQPIKKFLKCGNSVFYFVIRGWAMAITWLKDKSHADFDTFLILMYWPRR
jgi:hypothetical protein